jgi:hypothetical protein
LIILGITLSKLAFGLVPHKCQTRICAQLVGRTCGSKDQSLLPAFLENELCYFVQAQGIRTQRYQEITERGKEMGPPEPCDGSKTATHSLSSHMSHNTEKDLAFLCGPWKLESELSGWALRKGLVRVREYRIFCVD